LLAWRLPRVGNKVQRRDGQLMAQTTEFTCANCHYTIRENESWSISDGKAVHRVCPVRKSRTRGSKEEEADSNPGAAPQE
jgi:hypothetical protein